MEEKIASILNFEQQLVLIKHNHCHCCRQIGLNLSLRKVGVCIQCAAKKNPEYYKSKRALPIWYNDNGEAQYQLPDALLGLSTAEKLLIQQISPFVPLHHIKSGTMGISGHVCAFEQDVQGFIDILPRRRNDANMIRVLQRVQKEIGSKEVATKLYRVRRTKVLGALAFLKKYSREYKDIIIDESNLDWIHGEEGDLEGATISADELNTSQDDTNQNADMGPAARQTLDPKNHGNNIGEFGYIDEGGIRHISRDDQVVNKELQETVRCSPNKKDICVDWPTVKDVPVSEFGTTRIFARAFPWLFPGGIGDPKDYPGRVNEWGAHMLYYEDGRFAKDKIFSFFAMNYIIRQRNASSGRFFIDKFQRKCPKTLDDLKESILKGDTTFVNSLCYYQKRVKGSNPYWMSKRSELYTWINHHVEVGNGAPMFFITLSCAEFYWKDVIRLLKERMQMAGDNPDECYVGSPKMAQILNGYSIVVQEYFQKRVEVWLETVGRDIFGITNYWVRYEFAPGRGQIHAHLLAISKDQSIYQLCHNDMKMEKGEEVRAQRLAQWTQAKFGLTASVSENFDTIKIADVDSPCQLRFSDIPHDEQSLKDDANNLMSFCQCHNCSAFCMRKKTGAK